MLRRAAATLVALAVCLTAMVAVPGEPAAATPRPGVVLAPSTPILGERITVRVRLPRGVRPTRLQRRVPARGWVTIGRSSTRPTGVAAYRHRVRQPRARLRVVAPAARVDGRRQPRVVSAVRRVDATAPQTVSFTATRAAGGADLRVTLSHRRRGRAVHVQQRAAGEPWRTLRTVRARRSRVVRIQDVPVVRGASLRVRLGRHRGARAVRSAVLAPPTVTVRTVVEGADVRSTATTTGSVERVRFYADGVLVAEDTSPPWAATWSSRIGVHDVVARAVGPLESTVSDAATYDVGAGPVGADSGVAEGFALETVQSGLLLPTSAGSLPSGAVLVTEKSGLVKVVEPDDGTGWSPPREVLDLRDEVHDGGDAGLVGLAVDPDVASNGHVYLSYVLDGGSDGRERSQQVARFTWDGEVLDPRTRRVVLGSVTGPACSSDGDVRTPDCVPLLGEAHTIGDMVFDDEGRLLVGIGDGALYLTGDGLLGRHETWRAQDPEVLAGKVLRIDPATGRGVPDNPLYTGDGTTNASRVLALGLRNPFRFTVHEDRLVIGDVGEGATEEIDVQLLGEPLAAVPNFGWPCLEGDEPTALGDVSDASGPWHGCADVRLAGVATPPAHSYPHATGGGSISGGVFLDSRAYPERWRGRYVFGDYAQNFIRTAEMSAAGRVSGLATLADATAAGGPVKFFTGPDGLAWSVSIMTGSLQRILWTGEELTGTCPVGTFRRTFHDLDGPDSVFDREFPDDEWRWLFPYAAAQLPSEPMGRYTCEPRIHLDTAGSPWTGVGSDDRAHPGDRFGAAWRGRLDLEQGTYRFVVQGTEWVRLWVDDVVVHDFYGYWGADTREHEVTLGRGQHVVRAEAVHGDVERAFADITWSRVGGAPSIRLEAPANGAVATDGTVDWRVVVSDPDGDSEAALADHVELAVDFLHYTGSGFHAHPSSRITGQLSGGLTVDDVHAPGNGVVRLRASVTDATGTRTTSAPVYVCFTGGDVGPCGD